MIAVIVTTVVNQQDDSPSGIAGTWEDGQGNAVTVRKSGSGSYAVRNQCGEIRLTGSDSHASGTGPLYDRYNCSSPVGQITYSITLSADGSAIELARTAQTEPGVECVTCGTLHLRRTS